MEQPTTVKFNLSVELITRYRRTSNRLIDTMQMFNNKFVETELIIYDKAKKILQAVIGKLEIVISYGPCEFEWMDEVHKSILDFNECTDKYEDILYDIDQLPKPNSKRRR
ncbi:hypothetical protein GCK72_024996 [Caenorhabditis remanei]|uniref:Uncharacterized protein n=1 Tax=Caenorhabditis remanei TaxID=31234 RepID=A0A6A5G1X0_CAERE|nr:hypothetical protein GCK72_024996 [Caenorhabditis remanei]KAF1748529.1 hypothetical protein GCK72_024996 [Caenorhabditis remanei]